MKNEDEEDNIKIFDLIEDGSNEEHKDEKSSNNDVILNEDYKNRIYIADKDKENQNLYIKKLLLALEYGNYLFYIFYVPLYIMR